MDTKTCACPRCKCAVDERSIEKDGQRYCSQVCAIEHADGSEGCEEGCLCGVPQRA
ncbi:MAG: metallothionein [Halomonadaceae bacterium]|nr:metallothionein [Halomonadaceae bacterium]